MLHRFPGEFVCRTDLSLGFGEWLDRLGITAVSVDTELVHLKCVAFTETQTRFAGDRLHIISTARPVSIARLPRTLRERRYCLATPWQYCRFLEIADALGQWMHFLLPDHTLLLPRPELVLHITGRTPIVPAALLIKLPHGKPNVLFSTKRHAPMTLDCSTHVLACPNGRPPVPFP